MRIHILFLIILFAIYLLTGGDTSSNDLRKRKRQVSHMGFLLFLFAALRSPTVGVDVLGYDNGEAGYYLDYIRDATMSFQEILFNWMGRDPIFHCFIKILSYLWDSPQFMLIVISGVFAFGFSYFVYHSKGNVLLIFMMLIGFRIFSFSLSGLRQAIALGLIYIAYVNLRDKRYVVYLLLTIVAMLFHQSAMIFLIALPLMFIKSIYLVAALFLFGVLISTTDIIGDWASLFYLGRFDSYVARSQNMGFEGGGTFIAYILFYLLILAYYRPITKKDAYFGKEFSIVSIGIFFSIVGQSMDNVFRIAYYFIFLLFPAASLTLDCMFTEKKTSRTISFIASLLLAIQYVLLGTGAGTENYEFFWTFNYF